jgi:Ca2+-binding EF-hand superfamily protein
MDKVKKLVCQIFKLYDTKSKGVISKNKVNYFLKKIGSSVKTKNSHTIVSFLDLIQDVTDVNMVESLNTVGEVISSFIHLDYNSDGCISKDDLHKSMKAVGIIIPDEDISILHSRLDVMKNGCPTFEQYFTAVG